jgi:hypothetical protein
MKKKAFDAVEFQRERRAEISRLWNDAKETLTEELRKIERRHSKKEQANEVSESLTDNTGSRKAS